MPRKVCQSLDDLKGLSSYQKAAIYIPATLRDTVPLVDNGEQLAGQSQIETAGIKCKPFWDDDLLPSDAPVDEGETLRKYKKSNPSFGLEVRKTVLEKLVKAHGNLPKNWRIVLKSGLRPLEVQRMLFDAMHLEARRKYPAYTDEQLFEYTKQYVADPNLAAPAHTTGGAIDILVENSDSGEQVDMGSPINIDGEISMTFNKDIPKQAQENRVTLLKAMLAAGFANLPDEWWHFSYGDPYWAAFYSQPKTLYSKVQNR